MTGPMSLYIDVLSDEVDELCVVLASASRFVLLEVDMVRLDSLLWPGLLLEALVRSVGRRRCAQGLLTGDQVPMLSLTRDFL